MKVKLEDVCTNQSSNLIQRDIENMSGEYPVYGAAGYIKNIDTYKQDKAYIGIVKDGAGVGRTMLLPAKSSVIGTLQYILPKDNIDIGYLNYALIKLNLAKYASGATIPHIYFKDYKKEVFELPGIDEQRNIVNTLDRVSHLLTLRHQQLEKLDLLVKSRFVEMFGDVIINSKKLPVKQLGEISESRLGKMLDAKQQTGKSSYKYLANFNVQWLRFDLNNLHEMDFSDEDQKEFLLKKGDLLVTEGGEVGRCAIWNGEIDNCFFQKALHRVRCNNKIILPIYLAWYFKFHSEFNQFEDIVGGSSTIPHLTGVKLKKLEIPIPRLPLQNQFAAFVQQVDKSKFVIKQSIEKLELLKKKLMQDYFG